MALGTILKTFNLTPGIAVPIPHICFDGQYWWESMYEVVGDLKYVAMYDRQFNLLKRWTNPPLFGAASNEGGLAFDGQYLLFGTFVPQQILVSDRQLNLIKTISLTYAPCGFSIEGPMMWTSDEPNGYIRLRDRSGTLMWTSPALGFGAYGICSDGQFLWVADFASDDLYLYSKSGIQMKHVELGAGLLIVDVKTDGQYLYVTEYSNVSQPQVLMVSKK